ncbi:MAG: RsmB/NOP family class I SAM-dependent RNA methyltransferase [Candidatus Uhrbacteria bacterium]|nr:RsmB/NOP family class I SAM-dependent RNA methyltransferase [Candidatus Uhrbacteria bacterium]
MPALPQPLLERLERQFGQSTRDAIVAAFGAERRTTLRVNTLKATDDEIMNVFRDQAIQFERVKGIPHAFGIKNRKDKELLEMPIAQEGKIYLQGLTSMLPPFIVDPKPGEMILDLCAAPGSKTSQMAAMMALPRSAGESEGDQAGRIVACEDNEIRFQKLANTMRVQGASVVDAKHVDATLLHHEMPEAFDKVLADVPCGAEGRVNSKDVRSFSFWSEKNIIANAKLQRRLLRSAVGLLKPGGMLVYSTCTLAPEENEDMVAWLMEEFPFMKPQPVTLPFPSRKGPHGEATLLPTKDYEGFFVAKLVKKT